MKTLNLIALFVLLFGFSFTITAQAESQYAVKSESNGVVFEYTYETLHKDDVQLVSVKITNNSNADITLGEDSFITFTDGEAVSLLEADASFEASEGTAAYLFHLLYASEQSVANTDNTAKYENHFGGTLKKGETTYSIIAFNADSAMELDVKTGTNTDFYAGIANDQVSSK